MRWWILTTLLWPQFSNSTCQIIMLYTLSEYNVKHQLYLNKIGGGRISNKRAVQLEEEECKAGKPAVRQMTIQVRHEECNTGPWLCG